MLACIKSCTRFHWMIPLVLFLGVPLSAQTELVLPEGERGEAFRLRAAETLFRHFKSVELNTYGQQGTYVNMDEVVSVNVIEQLTKGSAVTARLVVVVEGRTKGAFEHGAFLVPATKVGEGNVPVVTFSGGERVETTVPARYVFPRKGTVPYLGSRCIDLLLGWRGGLTIRRPCSVGYFRPDNARDYTGSGSFKVAFVSRSIYDRIVQRLNIGLAASNPRRSDDDFWVARYGASYESQMQVSTSQVPRTTGTGIAIDATVTLVAVSAIEILTRRRRARAREQSLMGSVAT